VHPASFSTHHFDGARHFQSLEISAHGVSNDWKLPTGGLEPQRGCQPPAQGWRVFEPTLGGIAREKFNPEGVAAREQIAHGFNPFRVENKK
jgi:hypothetical protein